MLSEFCMMKYNSHQSKKRTTVNVRRYSKSREKKNVCSNFVVSFKPICITVFEIVLGIF